MDECYKVIKCKKVLDAFGVLETRFWTRHGFDPYINCEFNCVYCNYRVDKCTGSKRPVYAKANSPQILPHELKKLKIKGVVSLGAATDVYQPAEKEFQITRQLLEILKEHNCPFAIGTKSDLVLKDLDIITEASRKSWCCISISITTINEQLAKILEPNAPSPNKRLKVVKTLSDHGVMVGVWLTPIIPFITDNDENMESVIKAAVNSGAKFVLGGALDTRNLKGFKLFLKKYYPELIHKYDKLYRPGGSFTTYYPDNAYLFNLYKRFIYICQEHMVENYIPHFHEYKHALLFYLQNFSKFKGTPTFEFTQIFNYSSPFRELLQTLRIRFKNNSIANGVLKTFRYFPH
jgi:DNA repair photolyase